MKIAVFHNLPKGGAMRVVEEQVKGLKKKHHVDVFTPRVESYLHHESGIQRLKFDFFKFWTLRKIHQQLAEKIDKKNYDVVLVHPSKYTQAPYLLRNLRTRSFYYVHEVLRIGYEYNLRFQKKVNIVKKIYEETTRFLRKKIDFENIKSADRILANSCHTKEAAFKAYGVYSFVCYPGVDIDHFRPIVIKKKREVLFIGEPKKINGFDFLKKVISLIQPMIRLRVVRGNLSEKKLVEAYNQAVAVVCASEVEPFGLVPLESMACQTPVIAVKEGGYRETVINGVTGFLVDREPKLFAEKIVFLLKNPKLAKKMGEAGRKYVKKEWSWNKSIKRLEERLNETISFNNYC